MQTKSHHRASLCPRISVPEVMKQGAWGEGSCHCGHTDRPWTLSWQVPSRPHREVHQAPLGLRHGNSSGDLALSGTESPTPHSASSPSAMAPGGLDLVSRLLPPPAFASILPQCFSHLYQQSLPTGHRALIGGNRFF